MYGHSWRCTALSAAARVERIAFAHPAPPIAGLNAATIRGRLVALCVRLLFGGSYYSKCGYYSVLYLCGRTVEGADGTDSRETASLQPLPVKVTVKEQPLTH